MDVDTIYKRKIRYWIWVGKATLILIATIGALYVSF